MISLLGKPPLYPGFPAAGWEEGCLVSSRATQMCRSRDSAALWSYGNKTKSESAKVSNRGGDWGGLGGAVRTTGRLKAKGNLMDTKYSHFIHACLSAKHYSDHLPPYSGGLRKELDLIAKLYFVLFDSLLLK